MDGLTLTLEVPPGKGLPVEGVADALQGIQDAVRQMVEHLGDRHPRSGRSPNWVIIQSALQVAGARSGSLIIDLELAPPASQQPYLNSYGPEAIDALLNWDGEEGSGLPVRVTDRLYEIRAKLPEDVKVWLGSARNRFGVELNAKPTKPDSAAYETEALLYGWLREVNWHRRTAQLHDRQGGYVGLRFDVALDEPMLRLATQYVQIRGHGRINAEDEWTTVQVGQINPAGSLNAPFDKEEFLNDLDPRIFDPEQVVRASEPFDVDEFIHYIRDARNDGTE